MNNLFLVKKHKHSTGIYASRFASGNADWNKRWADFKVTANIHDDFAMELYNHLQVSAIELYNHLQVFFSIFHLSSQLYLCLLCILTSKHVLRMPFAGQNHFFLG